MFSLAFLLALLFPPAAAASPPEVTEPARFPPGFIWGTATAAVQVEGDTPNSDWAHFERRPHAIKGGQRIGKAVDAWNMYEQDFAQAAAMHTNGYRMSIEWSRLVPRPGVWDAQAAMHYRRMFESLHAKGIRPTVTLLHFSVPQWVADQGGWLNPKTIEDFAWFVNKAAANFGDLVDDWITINEPTLYACEGYVTGHFPPGRTGEWGTMPEVMANLAKAHGRAAQILRRVDTAIADPMGSIPCRVGIAENMLDFEPVASWNPLDYLVTGICEQWCDYYFLDAVTTGHIRIDTFWGRHYEDVPSLKDSLDFVGINYYTRWRVSSLSPLTRTIADGSLVTDLGLEIYPDGMYEVLKRTYARYHLPIYITETGIADAGRQNTPGFMVRHLERVARAIQDGIPVKGIYWWSLLDNFEWQNGFSGGRFGLLAVDYNSPKLTRSWTPAAHVYSRIAKQNAISPELITQYEQAPMMVGSEKSATNP
jgi:beta-glucosidase